MQYTRKRLKEPYCVFCGQEYDHKEAVNQCGCRLSNLFHYGTPYQPMRENSIEHEEPPGIYTDEQILSVIEKTIETHQTVKHKGFLINWLKGFSTKRSPVTENDRTSIKKLTRV